MVNGRLAMWWGWGQMLLILLLVRGTATSRDLL
jgi:hypothetical protein